MSNYLIEFADASERSEAGGKGYGLHLLTSWGLNVPPGMVLATDAYREMLASAQVSELLGSGDVSAIRSAIREFEADPQLADRISQAWDQLTGRHGSDLRVSCRSSATAEDSAGASFAGQFATVLGVSGPGNVLDAVRECWASVWSDEALSYRDAAGISHDDVAMAVVIQKMVSAESSGVAFSVNPVTGDESQVMINASWGLGETVVSGLVSPDMFLVQKSDREIAFREVSQSKTVRHIVSADGSIEEEAVGFAEASQPSLTDEQVLEVAEVAMTAEQNAGSPQDIEWAYEAGGELYVLQTRPITTL